MTSVRTAGAAILVSLVALAGCSADSDSESAAQNAAGSTLDSIAAPSSEVPSTEPPSAEPASTEPPVTEPAAAEPPVTEPPATDGPADTIPIDTSGDSGGGADAGSADCLVGAWVITQDEMNAYYDALEVSLAATGPAPTLGVRGQVELTLTPTEYTYTANFDLTFGVAGQEGTGASTGTVGGAWSAADGVIVTDTNDGVLSVSVSVGGITFDGSELANGLLNEAPIDAAPFDCAGPTLDLRTGEGTPRHTVTLIPA